MTFRDDHDAAVARITVLEDELARERARANLLAARVVILEQDAARRPAEPARCTRRHAPPLWKRFVEPDLGIAGTLVIVFSLALLVLVVTLIARH